MQVTISPFDGNPIDYNSICYKAITWSKDTSMDLEVNQ